MAPQGDALAGDIIGLRKRNVGADNSEISSSGNAYTWEEVAKHNTANDCWVAVDDKVYDITKWMNNHPGGKEILIVSAGRDITDAFKSYHPFTKKPAEVLKKFEIGTLKTHEFRPYKPDSGFYAELCEKVGDYFKKNGKDHKDVRPGLWRMALVMVVATGAFLATNNFWSMNFYFRSLAAVLLGICQALPLLHVMHDCSHLAFGHNQYWWTLFGRFFMDVYAGSSMTSWQNQHTIGHHIYTNVIFADPDLPAVAVGDPRRLVDRQKPASHYKYQHLYLPFLYGLLGLKVRYSDVIETFYHQRSGPVRINPITWDMHLEHILTKIVWAMFRIVLPLAHPAFDTTVAGYVALFLITEITTGFYLAFNFQVSHISTECEFLQGKEEKNVIPEEWAKSQVVSSVDYSHNNPITTFLCGALNYQVTHHLFPTVSQYHYPAIAPIIKEVCDKHKVKYPYLPSFGAAFYAHLKHLYVMGQRGEAAEFHMG